MAIKRLPISTLVNDVKAAIARKDGYIMGAKGQNPKQWSKTSWFFTQYADRDNYTKAQEEKALYWREHAQRVWDCNGLAEGIYEDHTDVNINTKARFNYSDWCSIKGKGDIPDKYRVPGTAVFIHSSKSGYITHVGYLLEPVVKGKPSGDWWVGEARGVMYGCVSTKLSARGWNRWGLMTKYFDYGEVENGKAATTLGSRTLRNGSEGEDVKQMQTALIRLGYDCGSYGADGDFGDATEIAVKSFQRAYKLDADGICGPKTIEALEKALAALDNKGNATKAEMVLIKGGNCYIRNAANKNGAIAGVAHENETFPYAGATAENGWNAITYKGKKCWVSGLYSTLM